MKQKNKIIIKKNSLLNLIAKKIEILCPRYKSPISGRNNIIINNGRLLKVKYDIVGDNNVIEFMQGSVLTNMMIYIRGNNHKLKIGKNCHYKGGSVWFEDNNCEIEIGQKTTIESAHFAVTEPNKKITIGEDCMFSYSIEFRTGDSHSIIDNETKERINLAQNIFVGNHVWIGAHSIILKGVNIGNNSIIGTNSVVTKSIPINSIAAGIPAKIIRNNVDWVRERIYDL
jgi:acetyltransferase-like isoleucine patch superfamily enzyme